MSRVTRIDRRAHFVPRPDRMTALIEPIEPRLLFAYVTNGTFEDPANPLSGWTLDGSVAVVAGGAATTGHSAILRGGSSSAVTVSQTVTVPSTDLGKAYVLSAWLKVSNSLQSVSINVGNFNDNSHLKPEEKVSSTTFKQVFIPFKMSGRTVEIEVRKPGGAHDAWVDDVEILKAEDLAGVINVAASPIAAGGVNVSFRDNSPAETGFRIERSGDGGATWQTVAHRNANGTGSMDRATQAYSLSKRYPRPNGVGEVRVEQNHYIHEIENSDAIQVNCNPLAPSSGPTFASVTLRNIEVGSTWEYPDEGAHVDHVQFVEGANTDVTVEGMRITQEYTRPGARMSDTFLMSEGRYNNVTFRDFFRSPNLAAVKFDATGDPGEDFQHVRIEDTGWVKFTAYNWWEDQHGNDRWAYGKVHKLTLKNAPYVEYFNQVYTYGTKNPIVPEITFEPVDNHFPNVTVTDSTSQPGVTYQYRVVTLYPTPSGLGEKLSAPVTVTATGQRASIANRVLNLNGSATDPPLYVSRTGTTFTVAASPGGTALHTFSRSAFDSIAVNGSTFHATSDLGVAGGDGLTVDVKNGAFLRFETSQHLNLLRLNNNSTAIVTNNGNRVLVVNDLIIAKSGGLYTARLDLRDNDMIVQASGSDAAASAFSSVTAMARSGRNSGSLTWGGKGLGSAVARDHADQATGLAVIRNSDNGTTAIRSSFAGQTVNANSILVKYSWNGDVNLDGKINAEDYHRIDQGFLAALKIYRDGDFNYDGRVNADDYFLIDSANLAQGSTVL